jgi:hypothetical protein
MRTALLGFAASLLAAGAAAQGPDLKALLPDTPDAKALLEEGFEIVAIMESGMSFAAVLQKDGEAYLCQMGSAAAGGLSSMDCIPIVAGGG